MGLPGDFSSPPPHPDAPIYLSACHPSSKAHFAPSPPSKSRTRASAKMRLLLAAAAALFASSPEVVRAMESFVFFGNGHPGNAGGGRQFVQPQQHFRQQQQQPFFGSFRQGRNFGPSSSPFQQLPRPAGPPGSNSFHQPPRFNTQFQPQSQFHAGFGGGGGGSPFRQQPRPQAVRTFGVRPSAPVGTFPAAGGRDPDGKETIDGRRYLFSWDFGVRDLSWQAAQQWCRSKGMKAISLESDEKAGKFFKLVQDRREEYFWTGGEVDETRRVVSWPGAAASPYRQGVFPFSRIGRLGPQPDGGERCLAVLNNTYNDGLARFHDVACHHTKPVICEE